MKRADRSHEITVFERNAPDATFGFGVVFPERTLRYLREADQETHEAFIGASITWDAIEYRHRGRVLQCGGHAFSGIARTDLLRILQQQAHWLGVNLRFAHEVSDLSAVVGCDLIVAADGINSLVRTGIAEEFQPSVNVGRSKYIWLGTTKVFDALTFIFEQSEHGWFGVHIYPYGATHSTFIVETDEASWRGAGLDRHADAAPAPGESDLDSLEYCERLFARHLDGHRLLANNSRWLNFRTVRNRVWHARQIVLLGDAAHTAHFSVGSGTRMAMEDAIALAHALESHTDLPAALAAYEQERRPAVRRIQRAAEPSRRWWEHFRYWAHFDPEPFAFHHLTRTRLLTYGTLKVRDPTFTEAVEAWFARGTARANDEIAETISPHAAPLRLRDVALPNRVVLMPPAEGSTGDDVAGRRHPVHLAEYADTGAGLVITGPIAASPDVRGNPGLASLWNRKQIDAWRRVTELVHAHSAARIGLQVSHGHPIDAPGASLLDDHVRLAQFAAEAGFDLLVLDYAAALDLVESVRAAWPDGRPLCVHLAAWEDPESDQAADAGLQFARALKSRGCDLLAFSAPRALAERDPERAHIGQIFASDRIRNLVGIPTMILGGRYTVGDVSALILTGRADLCEWPRLSWPGWRPAGRRVGGPES
jgi:anthraniloyl-CoA monooxygenase